MENKHASIVFYGQLTCQTTGKTCKNKAYWNVNEKYLCGVHSKRHAPSRVQLPKESASAVRERCLESYRKHNATVKTASDKNKVEGKRGQVVLYRMHMRKAVGLVPGFLNVFPNRRHGSRTDGLGLSNLSPMTLGPIEHGQPGLPAARNLENLHQLACKCYPCEWDEEKKRPKPEFYESRLKGLLQEEPMRRRFTSKDKPVCSIWVDPRGKEHQLSYAETKPVYCHFYVLAVEFEEQFIQLKEMVENGVNVRLCGYDAIPIPASSGGNDRGGDLISAFKDPRTPFGHERVLYTMLVEPDRNKWPWEILGDCDLFT